MKEPRHDDERLSALLDGRLNGPERDELLAYLAAADEDYHVLVETAAILHEVEAEDAGTPERGGREAASPRAEALPPSLTQRAGGWRRHAPRWIVPTVIAGLVVLGFFAFRGRAGAAGDPMRLAGQLEHAEQGLPGGWTEGSPWSITRGGAVDATRAARAAQAGAMMTALAVAVKARNATDTRVVAGQARARFDPRGGDVFERIAARAGGPPATVEPLLRQATARLEKLLVERDYLRLGAWTEAARLAARGQDAAFFRTGDTREMLRRADGLTRADAPAHDALSRVRAALAADAPSDWPALAGSLDALLGEIAS